MKIALLTLPFNNNYGGILQCFALKTSLERLGHRVTVLNLVVRNTVMKRATYRVRRALGLLPNWYGDFLRSHFAVTEPVLTARELQGVMRRGAFDAVVVGSDQVWRRGYAPTFDPLIFFLDFVPQGAKRVAYAASLGLTEWRYGAEESARIGALLRTFGGVSVREESAVALLSEHVGVKPQVCVDPTMLLSAADYAALAAEAKEAAVAPDVMVYWLGEREAIAPEVARLRAEGRSVREVYLRDDATLVSIPEWLGLLRGAGCVVTDSFHGCVFAMLFRRRVRVFANDGGGNGRLASLFRTFGAVQSAPGGEVEVDWAVHEAKLAELRGDALKFLRAALGGE